MSDIEHITDVETATLRQLEDEIEESRQRVRGEIRKMSDPLMTIRERRLYRDRYRTFEDYCNGRWGLTRSAIDKMIRGADAMNDMASLPEPPSNEAQARELQKVEPEKREAVMNRAAKDAPRKADGKPKITASRIREAAKQEDDWGGDEPEQEGSPVLPEHDADEACAKIAVAKRAVNDLMKTPAGRVLARWKKELDAKLDFVRGAVKKAMPYAECCYCNGRDKNCEPCEGSGWLDKAVYESAPSELKKGK